MGLSSTPGGQLPALHFLGRSVHRLEKDLPYLATTPMPDSDLRDTRLKLAVEARALEIELFWKRSFFFWGFIASAFVGYGALLDKAPGISVVLAGFGFVCSVAWTLANRGSKYWQENWETKVENTEREVTGDLFRSQEPSQPKGWFSACRYSVSRLAIALSDYTVLVWAVLEVHATWRALDVDSIELEHRSGLIVSFVTGTLIYVLFAVYHSRSRVKITDPAIPQALQSEGLRTNTGGLPDPLPRNERE